MQKFEIPWAAWRGRKKQQLTFPNNWKVTMASMAGRKNVVEDEIKQAFANPIGHETIRKLAEGKKTAAIAVDDLTRPTQAFRFMPFIVEELRKGGIGEDGIKIIMAIGCHRPLMKRIRKKSWERKWPTGFRFLTIILMRILSIWAKPPGGRPFRSTAISWKRM